MQKRIDVRVVISDPAIIARILEYQNNLSNRIGVQLNTAGLIRSLVVNGLNHIDQTNPQPMSESVSDSA